MFGIVNLARRAKGARDGVILEVPNSSLNVPLNSNDPHERDFMNGMQAHGLMEMPFPEGKLSFHIDWRDSIGLHMRDVRTETQCAIGSSAPDGYFCGFNFQDIKRWMRNATMPKPLPWKK